MMKEKESGQSLLEFAVILPLLILIVLSMVEVGYAMRNYILVMNANREGVRFAARGRFSDTDVTNRVIASAGMAGENPFLRTTGGGAANTGVIVTHILIPEDGVAENVEVTHFISGTVSYTGTRPISIDDSRIDVPDIVQRHLEATDAINDAREDAGFERLTNQVIVLEVFYAHDPLWNYDFVAISSPWVMYTQSSMRVVSDSRAD